jgi:DNA-binding response OmpR family regulator
MDARFDFKSFLQGDILCGFRYSAPRFMTVRILLIDDDPTLASELEPAFAERGLSIDHASSAESGKLLIEAFEYGVILLDMVLPRRSGIDLLRDLRKRGTSTPVVVVSAHVPDYLRALLTSFPEVKVIMPKPVDPTALAAIVATIVTAQ